jgi:hypothetical protein
MVLISHTTGREKRGRLRRKERRKRDARRGFGRYGLLAR